MGYISLPLNGSSLFRIFIAREKARLFYLSIGYVENV